MIIGIEIRFLRKSGMIDYVYTRSVSLLSAAFVKRFIGSSLLYISPSGFFYVGVQLVTRNLQLLCQFQWSMSCQSHKTRVRASE